MWRERARLLLKAGAGPVGAKCEAKAAAKVRRDNTFKAVALDWFEPWKSNKSERHAENTRRRLESDVYKELGALPVADVTASKLLAMAKKIESRGALDVAKRMQQTCGQILRYAVANYLIERNPAADVKPALPELLRKIQVYDGSPYTRMALQFMTLTFVRTGELIGARWDEIDLDAAEWRIPAERMKMDTPHIVPLSERLFRVRCKLCSSAEVEHEIRMGILLVGDGQYCWCNGVAWIGRAAIPRANWSLAK